MRLTQFRGLMTTSSGPTRAAAVSRDHVFADLGDRTVEQALDAGIDPRKVWRAVCDVYDVPPPAVRRRTPTARRGRIADRRVAAVIEHLFG